MIGLIFSDAKTVRPYVSLNKNGKIIELFYLLLVI